jgi:phosphatidylinositol glycan class V
MKGCLRLAPIQRLAATGVGGICIAMGLLLPQYIAYQEYCGQHSTSDGQLQRAWCHRLLPSAYAFVQNYYW